MSTERGKSFNYAIGIFGTSIPINMLKTYARHLLCDQAGAAHGADGALLLLYTFMDAMDNPVYGFLSDRTRTRWGRGSRGW